MGSISETKLSVPGGNLSNYLWKLLFLANCIVKTQQL